MTYRTAERDKVRLEKRPRRGDIGDFLQRGRDVCRLAAKVRQVGRAVYGGRRRVEVECRGQLIIRKCRRKVPVERVSFRRIRGNIANERHGENRRQREQGDQLAPSGGLEEGSCEAQRVKDPHLPSCSELLEDSAPSRRLHIERLRHCAEKVVSTNLLCKQKLRARWDSSLNESSKNP